MNEILNGDEWIQAKILSYSYAAIAQLIAQWFDKNLDGSHNNCKSIEWSECAMSNIHPKAFYELSSLPSLKLAFAIDIII